MAQDENLKALRLFCAVELPAEVRSLAAAHSARLRETGTAHVKVSWEREEKLHITLKFFGDVAAARLAALTESVARAAARASPFGLRLRGTGVFPTSRRPHTLWSGAEDNEGQLAALQRSLEDECARADFLRDPRPFRPHVTVARVRAVDAESRRLALFHLETKFESGGFPVDEIVLMRSEFGARGSTYTVVARFGLR